MKLWTKILIGAQSLVILFFLVYSLALASEAERQEAFALKKSEEALKAQQTAEEQAELARQQTLAAEKAVAEALEARDVAEEALARCSKK